MGNYAKAVGGGVGAAAGTIAVWIIETVGAVQVPDAVDLAIITLSGAAITYFFPANK